MMSTKLRHLPSWLLLATLPALAMAHPGHGAESSLVTGLAHPLRGLDHLFALLAVGLLAGRLGGRSLLLLAAAFLGLLGAGLAAGVAALPLPVIPPLAFITIGICALLMVAPGRRLPAATIALAACFAFLSGAAHGQWIIPGAGGWLYACGFMLTSAAVLAAGVAASKLLARLVSARGTR